MTPRFLLSGIGSLLLASVSADAQMLELSTARHVARQAGNHVSAAAGVLDINPATRALRFTSGDVLSWTLPLAAIRALHVEKDKHHYLVLHFVDTQGEQRSETFRLDAGDISRVASTLEHETGIPVDRSGKRQSFLGVPIRLAVGDRVEIRSAGGKKVAGKVLSLSATALTVASPQGPPQTLSPDDIARVRFVRSRGQNAARGFWTGGLFGVAFGAGMAVALNGAYGSGPGDDLFKAAGVLGLVFSGIGAAAATALPPSMSRGARDVYVHPSTAQKRSRQILTPRFTSEHPAVAVSVRF